MHVFYCKFTLKYMPSASRETVLLFLVLI